MLLLPTSHFWKKLYCCFKASREDTALSKLYRVGRKKLDKRLNIDNILRDIEDLKMVSHHYRHSAINKTLTKFKI